MLTSVDVQKRTFCQYLPGIPIPVPTASKPKKSIENTVAGHFCWTKVSFVGPLITPILDFVWLPPWVLKPGSLACLLAVNRKVTHKMAFPNCLSMETAHFPDILHASLVCISVCPPLLLWHSKKVRIINRVQAISRSRTNWQIGSIWFSINKAGGGTSTEKHSCFYNQWIM